MEKYIIRRLLMIIPVLFGVSIIIFSLIHIAPGNPYTTMIDPEIKKADKERALRALGYYDPIPVKYVKWVSRAVKGDLGYSIKYKEPVSSIIKRNINNTLLLSLLALIFSTLIAIPLGVLSAVKQYSAFDYIITIIAIIAVSIPGFFLSMILLKFLAFDLKLFPVSGMKSIGENYTGLKALMDRAHHMILPLSVLTFYQTIYLMTFTRSSMLEVIDKDFIKTAVAKGVTEKIIIYRHALRNALIPIVTILSYSIGGLISGAGLIETVFSWPGMGTLIYQSIANRDYPVVLGATMVLCICVLLSNLLADIMYAVVDPRIKYN